MRYRTHTELEAENSELKRELEVIRDRLDDVLEVDDSAEDEIEDESQEDDDDDDDDLADPDGYYSID